MKKILVLLTLTTQVYHIPLQASIFNWFKKKEIQKLTKNIPVQRRTQITLLNTEGSYTIKPWSQQKIALEVQKKGTAEQLEATAIKINTSAARQAKISTVLKEDGSTAQEQYTLRVPEDASIKITQTRGPVTINGIEGDIDISLEHGPIDIKGSTKTVIAKTGNGNITVHQRKLVDLNSIFLQAHKGTLTLYLPRETRASLTANVQRGTISSDHPVTMTITTKLDRSCWDRLKKEISGVLGNFKSAEELEQIKGSAPITLEVTRGKIQIKES